MLAYPLPEAESMLQEKLTAAEQSLANCDEDLEFLREQITVSAFLLFYYHLLYLVAFVLSPLSFEMVTGSDANPDAYG